MSQVHDKGQTVKSSDDSELRRTIVVPLWRLIYRRWLGTVICVLAVATFGFGFFGFTLQKPPQHWWSLDWSLPVYRTAQLFVLDSGADIDADHPDNWSLALARICAVGLFLVVSSTVILQFLGEVRKLPRRMTQKGHVVICGLGQIGLQVLDDLYQQKRSRQVVIVENNPLSTWLEYARSRGASVVIGDSTRAETLREARAEYAAEVIIVNGDDGVNLEVAAELRMLIDNRTDDWMDRCKRLLFREKYKEQPKVQMFVHIVDVNLATTLRPYSSKQPSSSRISTRVFNVRKTAATQLVTQHLWPYAPKEPDEVAHFVILGFGPMGQALAFELAQLGQFPNRKRSRFTIADVGIQKSARSFLSRFGRFTSWTETEIGVKDFNPDADAWGYNKLPLPELLRSPEEQAIQYVGNAKFVELPPTICDEQFAIQLAAEFSKPGVKPVVFACGHQDRDNFDSAVQLQEQLSNYGLDNVPIFVWLPHQPALASTLMDDERFIPFGECKFAASYEEITAPMREIIGRKIHEDYEAQSVVRGEKLKPVPWLDAEDDFRESSCVAADHLIIKMKVLGWKLESAEADAANVSTVAKSSEDLPLVLAEMEHYRWVAERLMAGWRFILKGPTQAVINQNKKRKLTHNLVVCRALGGEHTKDFQQVRTVLRECQKDSRYFELRGIPVRQYSEAIALYTGVTEADQRNTEGAHDRTAPQKKDGASAQ